MLLLQMHSINNTGMKDSTKNEMEMTDTMDMNNMNMSDMDMSRPINHKMSMSHVYSLNLPMNRNGSGYQMLLQCIGICYTPLQRQYGV